MNPALVRPPVREPDGVVNDASRKAVAIGFRVGHGRSAYPDPVKATQPFTLLLCGSDTIEHDVSAAEGRPLNGSGKLLA